MSIRTHTKTWVTVEGVLDIIRSPITKGWLVLMRGESGPVYLETHTSKARALTYAMEALS